MKTKKDLEKRIEELETLLIQKDDIISLLNVQYKNNIPDVNLGCEHTWDYSRAQDTSAGQVRVCIKCGIWETMPFNFGGYPYTTTGNHSIPASNNIPINMDILTPYFADLHKN